MSSEGRDTGGWTRIWAVFHEAVDRPPEERAAYLRETCGGDETLRRRIEDLLSGHEEDSGLLDAPAFVAVDVASGDEGLRTIDAGTVLCDRFEVVRPLGTGGMGAVYEARDRELGTAVALKVLRSDIAASAEAQERFRREVNLARRVTHPNACRMFDLFRHRGEDEHDSVLFLTMELLAGETLADRIGRCGALPDDEALRVVEHVAMGLAAAHAVGVVHRDLKAANVMLVPTEGGTRAVVMDFGIATSMVAGAQARATRPGLIIGSPATMAPEQLRGEPVSPATDVYALGLMLYEIATGHLPFEGDSPFHIAMRRLREDAPSPRELRPDLDGRWERCIARCLQRDATRRFHRPEQVVAALKGEVSRSTRIRRVATIGGGLVLATAITLSGAGWEGVANRPGPQGLPAFVPSMPAIAGEDDVVRLAVLPLSGSAQEADLAEGITVALREALDALDSVEVVSGSEMDGVDWGDAAIEDVTDALGVDLVLAGGIRVRTEPLWNDYTPVDVTVELIDGETQRQIWEGMGRGPVKSANDSGSRMLSGLAGELFLQIFPPDPAQLGEGCPEDAEARQALLRGRHWRRKGDWGKALRHYGEANALDMTCSRTLAALAEAHAYGLFRVQQGTEEGCFEMRRRSSLALKWDPDLPEAHAQSAWVSLLCDWDWEAAEEQFQHSLDLRPTASALHGQGWLLIILGRREEALVQYEQLLLRDPRSVEKMNWAARAYWLAGEHERALDMYRSLQQEDPARCEGFGGAANVLVSQDRLDEAAALLDAACDRGCACSDELPLYFRHAPSMEYEPPPSEVEAGGWGYGRALNHLALGQRDAALDWLERSYEERIPTLLMMAVDPRLRSLRNEPRFLDLIDRLHLPASWEDRP